MRTESPQFIIIDYGYIDSNITAAIGVVAERIYLSIRRKAWRAGLSNGDDLSARINQADLAKDLGLSRRSINDHFRILEHVGWIKKVGDKHTTKWQVGYYPDDFFADKICTEVATELRKLATEKGKTDRKGNPSIARLSSEIKTEFVQQWFGLKKGKVPESLLEQNLPMEEESESLEQNMHQAPDAGAKNAHPSGVLEQNMLHINSREEEVIGEEISKIAENSWSPRTPEVSSAERSEVEPDCKEDFREFHQRGITPPENSAPMLHRVTSRSVRHPDESDVDVTAIIENAKKRAAAVASKQAASSLARQESALDIIGKQGDNGYGMRILNRTWVSYFKEYFPETPVTSTWGQRERAIVMQMVKRFDGRKIEDLFQYAISEWPRIRDKLKRAPATPTLNFLRSVDDSLVPDAARYKRVIGVLREWNAWWDANPNRSTPPAELKARFNKHRKDLESLGLL